MPLLYISLVNDLVRLADQDTYAGFTVYGQIINAQVNQRQRTP